MVSDGVRLKVYIGDASQAVASNNARNLPVIPPVDLEEELKRFVPRAPVLTPRVKDAVKARVSKALPEREESKKQLKNLSKVKATAADSSKKSAPIKALVKSSAKRAASDPSQLAENEIPGAC